MATVEGTQPYRPIRPKSQSGPSGRSKRKPAPRVERGYGYEHQKTRRALLARFTPGDPCAHCGKPMTDDPKYLDLAHHDGKRGYRGLAHRWCNRADGAAITNAKRKLSAFISRW